MAHPAKTTVPVAGVVGGLIGLAFQPWWKWSLVGVAAGSVYAAIVTLLLAQVLKWLRRGSPERNASVTSGGWIGSIAAALTGAIAATVWFPPPDPGDSAKLFATGMIGAFAGAVIGFAVGGLAGGLLVALYDWLDTRYVTPLRTKSLVVDLATKVGLAVGVAVTGILVIVFGVRPSNHAQPNAPGWLFLTGLICLLLGVFWVIRLKAKKNRHASVTDLLAPADRRWRVIALAHALGFAGGAAGFTIGVTLYALGWRAPPPTADATRKEHRKARPG